MSGPRMSRPRWAARYGPERGTTYLLHFERAYRHARHYVGWTTDLDQRLDAHRRGNSDKFMRYVHAAGIGFVLARTWPDTTKDREDSVKHQGGASRICPECGVKPAAPRLASDKQPDPVDRRPMWMADRDGQWNDGTPIIYDPDQTWEQARASRAAMQIPEPGAAAQAELAALDELQRQWNSQEDQVGLRNAIARGAAAMRGQREAHQRRAANREADRLWAIADELDRQMGRRPGYQHELTAERAARIRARLGEDLVQDARLEAMPQAEGEPLEHWAITPQAARAPVLQGADLDFEIDRLADAFPEPERPDVVGERGRYPGMLDIVAEPDPEAPGATSDPGPAPWDWEYGNDATTWSPATEGGEPAAGQPGEAEQPAAPQPDLSAEDIQAFEQAERDRWAQVDRDTEYMARQTAQYYGPEIADLLGIEPGDAVPEVAAWEESLWEEHQRETAGEPGEDAATWSPALESTAAAEDALHTELGRQPEPPAEATQGPDIVADYLRGDLEERATAAEALRRLESRALAREHIAQASHDGASAAAAREQAAAFRQARLHAQAEAYSTAAALQEDAAQADRERSEGAARRSPELAPAAAAQLAGTAHTDPALAERGWQADHHGLGVRNRDAEAPGGRRELAGYEADSPDHQYGSPECAEADPEGAHFGRGPGEPMDTGRWPVLQADYGRMYIGPQAQAEAV